MSRKSRILIVDDHPIVRQGFAQLINQEPDLTVCAEVDTGARAFDAAGTATPDLAVVDIALPGASGLELIKNIKAAYPELRVLVLSMHDETLYAERALRAGAQGYIMKQEATDKVLEAIRRVLAGDVYLSEQMSARLLHHLVGVGPLPSASPIERLSDRELEVFRLIGQGHSTRQIAEQLNLGVKTVETYRAHIMEKLNLQNATELVQRAFQWAQTEGM